MVKVIISGATGFISKHIIKELLDKKYQVVGTVRSHERGEQLKKQFNSDNFSYGIVKAIEQPGSFEEVLKQNKDAEVFIHAASPFTFDVNDVEKEILSPAVRGTTNALKAIKEYGSSIKRVIVTSSYVSVLTLDKQFDPSNAFTEEDWSEMTYEQSLQDSFHAYCGSKKFAEQAAWNFVKEENPSFVLTAVLPLYVYGPQAFDTDVRDHMNASSEIINSMLNSKPGDELLGFFGGFIDVRDVARSHVIAFEKEETKNKRLLLVESKFTSQDIADIINDNFKELKGKIATGTPGKGAEIRANMTPTDNSWTRKIVNFKYSLEQSVVDTVSQILAAKK